MNKIVTATRNIASYLTDGNVYEIIDTEECGDEVYYRVITDDGEIRQVQDVFFEG